MGRGEKRLGDRIMGKAQQNEETTLSRAQSEGAERQVSAVAQMSAQDRTAPSFPCVNTQCFPCRFFTPEATVVWLWQD